MFKDMSITFPGTAFSIAPSAAVAATIAPWARTGPASLVVSDWTTTESAIPTQVP